jgi:putative flippase GtrA
VSLARTLERLPSFIRFGMVGTVGFIVDGGVLQLLVSWAGWGPITARLVSFPAAVLATWLLNRSITFRDEGPVLRSLGRYVVVSLGGAAVNFLVYTALILASPAMAALPIIPLAIASIIALAFNFLGSKHFAFR